MLRFFEVKGVLLPKLPEPFRAIFLGCEIFEALVFLSVMFVTLDVKDSLISTVLSESLNLLYRL